MTMIVTTSRVLLGLIFLVFGANGFYTFIPVPDFHPFMEILVTSNYIYVIKTIEVAGGILLLINRFVPLALALLIPDIVNIAAFHLFLDPRNAFIVPVLIVLAAVLTYAHRDYFLPLLTYRTD